jgi:uncharacterized protein (TIGR00255 family)
MLQSMTGFGKATSHIGGKKVDVEIRSLNSKQLDLNLRLPQIYRDLEPEIRNLIGNTLNRGKVDVYINLSSDEGKSKTTLNHDLAKEYHKELKKLAKSIDEKNVPLLPLILRMPDVFKVEETVDKSELKTILGLINKAADMVVKFREQEGKSLKKDIESHLALIEKKEVEVGSLDSKRIDKIRERLTSKLNEIESKTIDNNRFEQELIYYIERLDINEERTRLKTHCNYFKQTINEPNGGRKLGFIIQEIGREINTIGSKANDADIQKIVVGMKDELEKMKEQLLNIL